MALIKDRKLAADPWKLLEAGSEGESPCVPATGDVIVPLAVWRAQRDALLARDGRLGVWLGGEHDPAGIAADLAHLQVIAVRFASFTDGRGYSTAQLLRRRYGWRGELRAIGDVQRDQLFYLARCGFDAFVVRDGEDVEAALTAFDDFSEAYQASLETPLPLFRRREASRNVS
jgi:uncharacterized protein (DUF934 family)